MSQQNHTPIHHLINPPNPVSAGSKEIEPTPTPTESVELHEIVAHESVPEEVQDYIEVKKDHIELPSEVQEAGVEEITHTPSFPTYQQVKLPLSDEAVISGLHAPVSSSKRWISEFARYLLWQAHLTLKVIHGKVTRVKT